MITTILSPFDRMAAKSRGKRYQKVLRVKLAARTEPASDIKLDHVDGCFRKPHKLRQNFSAGKWRLCRALDHHAAIVPHGKQSTRLHGHGGVSLHIEGFAACIACVDECPVGIARCSDVFDSDV